MPGSTYVRGRQPPCTGWPWAMKSSSSHGLHQAHRDVLQVHPRSDRRNPLTGIFATRSPDRPNPLGLHPVVVREIDGRRLRVGPIEAIDGTPVVDIKPVLEPRADLKVGPYS